MKSRLQKKIKPRAEHIDDPKEFVLGMHPHAISITSHGDGFMAKFEDSKAWAAGRTPNEAIGDLIRTHGAARGINVTFDDGANRNFRRLQEQSLKRYLKL